jgi:uncharacterized protein YndB with AHSA1/START domain
MNKPSFVYVIYIASTPEKVFAALTDGAMSERYWDGNRLVSDWTVGAAFTLKLSRYSWDIVGRVLEVDPPRRLAYTFHPQHSDMKNEGPSRVAFEIEPQRDQVKLTIVHDQFEPGSKVVEHVSRGWPLVLSSLKSYLESGKVLRPHWYEIREAEGAVS